MDLNITINLAQGTVSAGGQTVALPAGGPQTLVLHFHLDLGGGAQAEDDAPPLAAIAAAVAMVIDEPHRVVSVRPAGGSHSSWSAEGRRSHFQSHSFR
jgi:hypothetical protein